ncbi:hypothetical protein HWV62_41966 [Athelia sp. TMB]|nr:hypothetical protein HWV62_41966 [Athelia sp. TMB]
MLSAVAARKAAQVPRQESTVTIAQTEPTSISPKSSSILPKLSKPNSKRKPSGQALNPARKAKKKKVAHSQARYFAQEDSFLKQDDVIVIEDEDSEDSEQEIADLALDILPKRSTLVAKGKRAWSPSRPLQDSSDEEDMESHAPPISDTPDLSRVSQAAIAEPPHLLSTFEPVWGQNIFSFSVGEVGVEFLDVTDKPTTVLILNPEETLAVLGTYALTLLRGTITLAGTQLEVSKTPHRIFAPRSSPIPVIKALPYDSQRHSPLPVPLPEIIRHQLGMDCTIIAVQELHSGVQGLGLVCRIFDGVFQPSRWHRNDSAPNLKVPGMHMLTHQHRDVHPFELSPSWNQALSSISPESTKEDDLPRLATPICIIKGPRKTGKSTFARTLLNRLVTRYRKVAFLECDLGQSEFTPGGMVALNIIEQPLFGPSFTHPTTPYLAHYIGSISPRSSPSHYLAAIQALIQSYKLDLQSPIFDIPVIDGDNRISDVIPLIVNTMGWNKGLGVDLNRQIEEIVQPTDVFEVAAPVFERGWSSDLAPNGSDVFGHLNAKKHILEPIAPTILANNFAPADHRILNILSYFHAVFPAPSTELQQLTAKSWNTTLPLCAQQPYQVDWSRAVDKIYLAGAGTEDVVSSELKGVLNGAIVGLVSCEPGAIDAGIDASAMPYSQGAFVVSPSMSTCHGIALIRAVSPSSSHMHVLSPLPPALLSKCKVIVKGEMELPVWGMLDFRSESGESVAGIEKNKVPYLQWGKGEGVGGERRRVRRNLMRKGQL